MRNLGILILGLLSLLSAIGACQEPCIYNEALEMELSFPISRLDTLYNTANALDRKHAPIQITNNEDGQPVLKLPLDLHHDTTAYVLQGRLNSDTLYMSYTRRQYYISDRCGMGIEIIVNQAWLNPRSRRRAFYGKTTISIQ